MAITFDVLGRFQENKVLQTAQIMNNISRLIRKWYLCHRGNCDLLIRFNLSSEKYMFGFNHSNYVVKTEYCKKRAVVR